MGATLQEVLSQPIVIESGVPAVTTDSVATRLRLLQLHGAPRVPLKQGEALGAHCEALIDAVCWLGNTPVPRSTLNRQNVVVGELWGDETFSFALAGMTVPSEKKESRPLPAHFPLVEVRGHYVELYIRVHQAQRILIEESQPADWLTAAGLPDDLEAAGPFIVEQLTEEREQAVEISLAEKVAAFLGERLGVVPSPEETRKHCALMWQQFEEPRLIALELDEGAKNRSQLAWVTSPSLLAEATSQLVFSSVVSMLVGQGILSSSEVRQGTLVALQSLDIDGPSVESASDAKLEQLISLTAASVIRHQLANLPNVVVTDR